MYCLILSCNFCLDLGTRLNAGVEKVTNLNSSISQLKQRVEELLVSVQTEQERTRLAGEKLKLVRVTRVCTFAHMHTEHLREHKYVYAHMHVCMHTLTHTHTGP